MQHKLVVVHAYEIEHMTHREGDVKYDLKEVNDFLQDRWFVKSITPLIPAQSGRASDSWASAIVLLERQ